MDGTSKVELVGGRFRPNGHAKRGTAKVDVVVVLNKSLAFEWQGGKFTVPRSKGGRCDREHRRVVRELVQNAAFERSNGTPLSLRGGQTDSVSVQMVLGSHHHPTRMAVAAGWAVDPQSKLGVMQRPRVLIPRGWHSVHAFTHGIPAADRLYVIKRSPQRFSRVATVAGDKALVVSQICWRAGR